MPMSSPFSQEDFLAANREWGANCGPAALAFALNVPINSVRGAIPRFESVKYTSPSMMKSALNHLGVAFDRVMHAGHECPTPTDVCDSEHIALVRVLWCGPWDQPGMNPRWAYQYTHWIAAWCEWRGDAMPLTSRPPRHGMVFDCNGGVRTFPDWQQTIVPILTGSIRRATGDWRPTHVWRLR